MGKKLSVSENTNLTKNIVENPDIKIKLVINKSYSFNEFLSLMQILKPSVSLIDLDGTITKTSLLSFYLFYIKTLPKKLYYKKFISLIINAPKYIMLDFINRDLFQEAFYKNYYCESHHKLSIIAKKFYDSKMKTKINKNIIQVIDILKKHSNIHILTTNVDLIAKTVADDLKIGCISQEFLLDINDNIAGTKFDSGINFKKNTASSLSLEKTSFGLGDSVSDIPFLKNCTYGFLYNKNNNTFKYVK